MFLPVHNTPVNSSKQNNPLGAISQKIGHFHLHHGGPVVFRNQLQVVPGRLTIGLEPLNIQSELFEVHFGSSCNRSYLKNMKNVQLRRLRKS